MEFFKFLLYAKQQNIMHEYPQNIMDFFLKMFIEGINCTHDNILISFIFTMS